MNSVDAHGKTYIHHDNVADKNCAERLSDCAAYSYVNTLTIYQVLVESGLMVADEGTKAYGYAGQDVSEGSVAIKKDPKSSVDIAGNGVVQALNKALGSEETTIIPDFVPVPSARRIDAREVRLMLDKVLKLPDFEKDAEIVRKRREELFGNK